MSGKDFYDDEPSDHNNAPPTQYYRPDQKTTGDFFAPPAGAPPPKQPTVTGEKESYSEFNQTLEGGGKKLSLIIFVSLRALKNGFLLNTLMVIQEIVLNF